MNVWVSFLNARFKLNIFKKEEAMHKRFRKSGKVNAHIHKMAERFNNYEKNTMHLWAICSQWNEFCCVLLLIHEGYFQKSPQNSDYVLLMH